MKAAKDAFPDWSAKSPAERSQVLNKLADLIEARLEEFVQAESKDQGNCIVLQCIDYIDFMDLALHIKPKMD